ncbi:MAG: tRNA (guanosine(46)-N7)-methyltransferase TrmB [Bacteroidales bacterium]|nr:tRNA (guanosine(46)-N7)-methyltransferase TrmB [Bacteroidales bacterium]
MGHDKLRKFAENRTFSCLLQPDAADVLDRSSADAGLHLKEHPIRGHWNEKMFDAPRPIVLELGCGKGDYTIALAERHPECNYIGVDIKGARLWKGAKYATQQSLGNVAFLRTRIEFIGAFFAPGEVAEIWLTFSDPQLKSENSRLTSPLFLERYRGFLAPGGRVHLKTDSRFLYEYSLATARANGLTVLCADTDIYAAEGDTLGPTDLGMTGMASDLLTVQTFYERMFLEMGLPITYLSFLLDHDGPFVHPADFDADYWRRAEGPRRTFSHQRPKQLKQ